MVNKVILIGNLGKDPEVKTLEGDVKVATFTLATSESYKDKQGEKKTNTTWHNIVLWRGLAGVAEQYLKKGMQLYVEGKITNRSYDDKDGIKRFMTEIVGSEIKMMGSKGGDHSAPPPPVPDEKQTTEPTFSGEIPEPIEQDDLPF